MKNFKHLALTCILLSMTACQTPPSRSPGAIVTGRDWSELRSLKQRKVELGAMSVHFKKKKNEAQLEKINAETASLDKKIAEIESKINSFTDNDNQTITNDSVEWREEEESLELAQLDLYKLEKNVQFAISTYEARETKIKLTHKFFSGKAITPVVESSKNPMMHFTATCDAPFEISYGKISKKGAAQKMVKFSLADRKYSTDYRNITIHPNMKSCEFKFYSSYDTSKEVYGFKLVNETNKLKSLESLMSTTEVCSLKKGTGKFFENTEFANMTCPRKYDSIQILPEPEDSLHARVEALLGKDLPADFVKNGNPYAELDFSKAPKFDAILVSYLVFRADFYGTLLGRLLAYHADQGTLVRIVVSEVIALKKDEAMFERLMAEHPNMKVVKYSFDTSDKGGARISELHRTNHVKLFIAYSKNNPSDSMVIVGGRNIHDGFVFKTPVDVSKFPEVVSYGGNGDESWAYWRDFEMVIRGQDFTESLVRHYMNFYHMNKSNLVMKISSVAVQKEGALESEEESIRHYVSIPFKDETNLNIFYARLIDSSKKKILISSPYFRPVKEIADALERAVTRGVDITIITRLDLEGDTADFILGAVNKDGVNRYLKNIKVFEYTEPKVILHSKLLMIDDEVSFISSVNLNKRSFYHDLENGSIVNDRKFTTQMGELYKEYLKISTQLTEKQKIVFWKKWIIKIFDKVL